MLQYVISPPPTGKTSTVSFAVRALVARGKRVLVTSYTHAAVDNLMEKLKEAGMSSDIVGRIGAPASVNLSVHEYLLNPAHSRVGSSGPIGSIGSLQKPPLLTVHSIDKRLQQLRIVGCTVLTASRHALLQTMKFDWCVMDESGQISQPASLGALMLASHFMLIGDDYQLPPIVISLEAQAGVSIVYIAHFFPTICNRSLCIFNCIFYCVHAYYMKFGM
jgi:DNA replication ATP-dependent helicase Dna2